MRERCERPPLFAEIDAAFAIVGKRVIFAWGDTIYNPEGVTLTPALHAHEAVHGERQLGTAKPGTARGEDAIRQWWHRYMTNPQFRLVEELLAHKVEFETLCKDQPGRHARRFYLQQIARKLSSPLYGRLISYQAARKELTFQPA